MVYKLAALGVIAIFYCIYCVNLFLQKKDAIIAASFVVIVQAISMYIGFSYLPLLIKLVGFYMGVIGDGIYILALLTMRYSWKNEGNRHLVTTGIYKFSRNPEIFAFDLEYIGILIMFFNPVLLVVTIFAIIILHLQILKEEKDLEKIYGKAYLEYKSRTNRYFGWGKFSFDRLLLYIYLIIFIWCGLYLPTCLIYVGGPRLSFGFIWVILGVFSLIRVLMLYAKLEGKPLFAIPKWLKWTYRVLFLAGLMVFIAIEAKVIGAMKATPKDGLDYVVVLGAGMRNGEPSKTLRARIERAAEYLENNPNTMVIASGGKGKDEPISEAKCIGDYLIVRMGVSPDRIILEENSTDTVENLKFSYNIIGDEKASVGIITNGFHELRATTIAKNVGYKHVEPVPADTMMPVGIHYIVREFFGMLEVYLLH